LGFRIASRQGRRWRDLETFPLPRDQGMAVRRWAGAQPLAEGPGKRGVAYRVAWSPQPMGRRRNRCRVPRAPCIKFVQGGDISSATHAAADTAASTL
jgi:hypothetical protein